MESDCDHVDFDNDSRWPRRLLHVPSMTSYKWEPGNSYRGHEEPDYVALSYTWGRYMLRNDESPQIAPLLVRGVPWPIPRVNPSTHFSVAEFQHIIWEVMKEPDRFYTFSSWKQDTMSGRSIGSRILRLVLRYVEKTISVYEFLWLDIACIDQRWTATTMAEIGRQARIFRGAKHSYAWLSHLCHETLQTLLLDLNEAVTGLQSEPFHQESFCFDSRPWVTLALKALSGLKADPWFTSLWTLQESFLCNHAVILSREGELTCEASLGIPKSYSLNYLFKLANNIILWSDRTRVDKEEPSCSQLLESVHSTGLAALWYNTPMALLGVSHCRNTTRELDRVYGIMQVFGSDFRVGHAKDDVHQSHAYTLSELEDELGAAIIQSYPLLSQMHIYLEAPEFGKAWCVRGKSTVPMIAERGDMFGWHSGDRIDVNINIVSQKLCELSTRRLGDNTWAYLSGKACPFDVLQSAWVEVDRSEYAKTILKSGWRMHRCSIPSVHMIALDRGTGFAPQPPELNALNVVSVKDEERQHHLAQWIVDNSKGLNMCVFILGRSDFGDEYFIAGLILIEKEAHGVIYWHRIGICVWLVSHLSKNGIEHPLRPLLNGEDDQWYRIEGLFG